MKIRVYYEDTDVGGVVYHANYLKFCERARSEIFFASGRSPMAPQSHFVVRHVDAMFHHSAYFGDLLEVSSEVMRVHGATLILDQKIYRAQELLFEMRITLIHINSAGRPTRMEEDLKMFLSSPVGEITERGS